MKYRYISFPENYAIARDLLEKLGYYERHEKIPIDPELICRDLEIPVIPIEGLSRGLRIQGFVLYKKAQGNFEIYIDKKHYNVQSHSSMFTVGEELGHIFLHTENIKKIETLKDWEKVLIENAEFQRNIESQAKLFSSYILLPDFLFKNYVMNWIKKNYSAVKEMKNIYSEDDLAYSIGSKMQHDLGVSASIIQITLKRWPDHVISDVLSEFPELLE